MQNWVRGGSSCLLPQASGSLGPALPGPLISPSLLLLASSRNNSAPLKKIREGEKSKGVLKKEQRALLVFGRFLCQFLKALHEHSFQDVIAESTQPLQKAEN